MNKEMDLRKRMTSEVVDSIGEKLINLAVENGCDARFTGAGGGGCIWAIGEVEDIVRLEKKWESLFYRSLFFELLNFWYKGINNEFSGCDIIITEILGP